MTGWFEVDKEGLREQLVEMRKAQLAYELIANGFDEIVTAITVELHPVSRGLAELRVVDDSPDGFADLTDAWTFFKPSKKAIDADKRGRYNTGEKNVLAWCKSATITSTRGKVSFVEDGTRKFSARTKRDAGTEFAALVMYTKAEVAETLAGIETILVPPGVTLTVNGVVLESRVPHKVFGATLATEVNHRPTRRATTVELHVPRDGETPMIYEMGIPVVEHDSPWHISVQQVVPMNRDRNNVPAPFLRALRTAVLDNTASELTNDDANSAWVKDAIPQANDESVRATVKKRFGSKVVVFDPTDREANKQALDKGYTVVHGRTLSKPEWTAVRRTGAMLPAGQVLPSGVKTSPDGIPPIPTADWSADMCMVAEYTQIVGDHLLGFRPNVEFIKLSQPHAATWAGRTIRFNLRTLRGTWPATVTTESIDELLIHEFAHHVADDHLTEKFYSECCRLGAKLRNCKAELR